LKCFDEASAPVQAAKEAEHRGNLSREIRPPINGMIGMTDLLLDSPLDPQQREATETLPVNAQALLAVINEIVDFSRIDQEGSGAKTEEPARISPSDLPQLEHNSIRRASSWRKTISSVRRWP